MPTSDREPEVLVDTSVAVPLVTADHEQHEVVFDALKGRRLGLSGHAAFETFSVLTRLPSPTRRTPAAVGRLLAVTFPHSRFLSPRSAATLLASLADKGIAGGSVYDALVGAAAKEHGVPLATRDARAAGTYRTIDVDFDVIASR
jgi:predicted nucleic acid-binding protein